MAKTTIATAQLMKVVVLRAVAKTMIASFARLITNLA
jgi:hypothetical protein